MARSRVGIWFTLLLVPALIVLGGGAYLIWRQRVPGVRATLHPTPKFIGTRVGLSLDLHATRGSVRDVEVAIVQGASRVPVAQQAFAEPALDRKLELNIAPKTLGLQEGPAVIEVKARDGFWRPLRIDDRPILSAPVTVDVTPPALEVLGATRYLHQGGGGLAVMRVKGAARAGVKVGDALFPAYTSTDGGEGAPSVVFFALPWNLGDTVPIVAWAQDEAGNASSGSLPSQLKPRRFPSGTVELTDRLLAAKLPELLPERPPASPDGYAAAFLLVNRDLRKKAEDTKRQLAARSQPKPLWQGAFVQPRNTKVFSNFAESRSYRYGGKEIDTAVHLGFDLASLKQSPIPAANSGVVVWAGPLTIYGNTVVVDHGLGLQTLYGHLSSIAVKEGDKVEKGQELGRSGTTGLAVGDHLHYEVLIGGVSVTPVEWWDGRWIRDHIGLPLREANIPMLQSEFPADGSTEPPPPPRSRRSRAR